MSRPSSGAANSGEHVVEIAIGGMTCGACSSSVTDGLREVSGVSAVDVSLITERAIVHETGTDPQELIRAVEDRGFEATLLHVQPVSGNPELVMTSLKIQGMTCGNCTGAIRSALERVEGVKSAEVSLSTETAVVEHENRGSAGLQELLTAIDEAGFDAQFLKSSSVAQSKEAGSHTLELKVFGLTNEESVEAVETALITLPGVITADVSLPAEFAVVNYDSSQVGIRAIVRKIESVGYSAIVAARADNAQQLESLNRVKELQAYYRDTWKTFILGVPIILLDKFRHRLPKFLTMKVFRGIWLDDILCLLLVMPILLGPARRFYVKSYKAIKAGTPTMDVLVTVSVTCAFIYSAIALLHSIWSDMEKHQMYLWDACAMILMFILFGKYLENKAKGQTSRALSELISLVPEQAYTFADDLSEEGELIPTDTLQEGDVVMLRPGEKISADGIVIFGDSYVSESLITGEAKPIRKREGDQVVGGTINGLGTLRFRVTRCGTETKLAQIVEFIKDAQVSRAPIQRYADMAAGKFVPAVLALALFTFTAWFIAGLVLEESALPHVFHDANLFLVCLRLGISVVVVACPCALGLATPTAVMVGTGIGARNGILVKGGAVFERGSHTSVVLFDKTGTLTTGRMSVVATTVPPEYWPYVRAIESLSEHPVAKALANYQHRRETISDKQPHVEDFEVLMGEGVRAKVDGKNVFVGRQTDDVDGNVSVKINGTVVGSAILKDSLRSDAQAVVEALVQRGMTVGLVSGDGKGATDAIASEINVDPRYVWSQMRPEDKVRVIETLESEGRKVAFVGDGINDSPALAAASMGISLEGATDVAVESADVVLTHSSPIRTVPATIDLCKATMRRIKINLFASVIYNVIMIPFAMGLLLPFHIMLSPMMASGAMALSSISVVTSSLLLQLWRPPTIDDDEIGGVVRPVQLSIWQRLRNALPQRHREPQYQPV